MQIIPAIDLYRGKCVRLTKGDFSRRTDYVPEPLDLAVQYSRAGATQLHVVDLEGAQAGRIMNWPAMESLASVRGLSVQAGGGIRTGEDISRLLGAGAVRVVVGSIALQSPELIQEWVVRFGPEKFCIAVDLKEGELAYHGWQSSGGPVLSQVVPAMSTLGITRFLSTDIGRDGMLSGPNIALYQELVANYPSVEWLASGGVRSKEDIRELASSGVAGVVIGKALLDGTLRIQDLLEQSC